MQGTLAIKYGSIAGTRSTVEMGDVASVVFWVGELSGSAIFWKDFSEIVSVGRENF